MKLQLIFKLFLIFCMKKVYVEAQDNDNQTEVSVINSTTTIKSATIIDLATTIKPLTTITPPTTIEPVTTVTPATTIKSAITIKSATTSPTITTPVTSIPPAITIKPVTDLLSKNGEIVKTNIKRESNPLNIDYVTIARQIKTIISGFRNIVEKFEHTLPRNANKFDLIPLKYVSNLKNFLRKVSLFCRILESIIKRKILNYSNQSKGRLFTNGVLSGLSRAVLGYNFYVPEVMLFRCLGRYVRGTYPLLSINEYPTQISSDIYQYISTGFLKDKPEHNLINIEYDKIIKNLDVAENEISLKEDNIFKEKIEKIEKIKDSVISHIVENVKPLVAFSKDKPEHNLINVEYNKILKNIDVAENEIPLEEDNKFEEKIEKIGKIKDSVISHIVETAKTSTVSPPLPVTNLAEEVESWSRCLSFYGMELFVRTLETFVL